MITTAQRDLHIEMWQALVRINPEIDKGRSITTTVEVADRIFHVIRDDYAGLDHRIVKTDEWGLFMIVDRVDKKARIRGHSISGNIENFERDALLIKLMDPGV